ncbi:hypothetical protein RHMOL_Rhmol06G0188400 [Rhododendron molle]|uniref:Uncharacterized protein n=1 Tax=Rhododendron molle TaxID=49168 RepID=A0ACC0NDQ8_RHOML|nr:hypothetical protein RHMOL_Rhmol06G0188400 [Rhododendron molle]
MIWIAAHLERKLRKNQVADTNIGVSVVDLMKPGATIILRNAKIDMFKGSMRLLFSLVNCVEYGVNPHLFVCLSLLLIGWIGLPKMGELQVQNYEIFIASCSVSHLEGEKHTIVTSRSRFFLFSSSLLCVECCW